MQMGKQEPPTRLLEQENAALADDELPPVAGYAVDSRTPPEMLEESRLETYVTVMKMISIFRVVTLPLLLAVCVFFGRAILKYFEDVPLPEKDPNQPTLSPEQAKGLLAFGYWFLIVLFFFCWLKSLASLLAMRLGQKALVSRQLEAAKRFRNYFALLFVLDVVEALSLVSVGNSLSVGYLFWFSVGAYFFRSTMRFVTRLQVERLRVDHAVELA